MSIHLDLYRVAAKSLDRVHMVRYTVVNTITVLRPKTSGEYRVNPVFCWNHPRVKIQRFFFDSGLYKSLDRSRMSQLVVSRLSIGERLSSQNPRSEVGTGAVETRMSSTLFQVVICLCTNHTPPFHKGFKIPFEIWTTLTLIGGQSTPPSTRSLYGLAYGFVEVGSRFLYRPSHVGDLSPLEFLTYSLTPHVQIVIESFSETRHVSVQQYTSPRPRPTRFSSFRTYLTGSLGGWKGRTKTRPGTSSSLETHSGLYRFTNRRIFHHRT